MWRTGSDHEQKQRTCDEQALLTAGNRIQKQIIAVLREQEAGVPTAEVCRKQGVSSATFYKWKAKFGGLDVSDAKRLRSLEDENGRLKRMLADAMLDTAALKDLLGKKW
jgi:putative transposase